MEENKPIIKKSIFRQKTFAKRYGLVVDETSEINNCIKTYKINCITNMDSPIEDKEIFTCNLSLPLLKSGERFYIEELGLLVIIESSYRTSSDAVCYYIEPKIVNDEITKNL